MGFLIFLFVLSFLIIVHEFGHLIAAKRFGVKVERFSIGFGYRLLKFKRKDIEYSISCIPFGGYVKLAGDNQEEFKGKSYEYLSKSILQRAKIVLSGPLLNYILAFFFFWLVFFLGFPHLSTKVGEVIPGFPAEKAGILPGDIIIKVDGRQVKDFSELQGEVHKKEEIVHLTILRGNREIDFVCGIQKGEIQDIFGKKRTVSLIGIRPKEELIFLRYGFFKSAYLAMDSLFKYTFITFKAIWAILTGSLSLRESITGPLGIFYITSKATKLGIQAVLHLMAILNLNLAIFNLLPLPILDGGHLLFLGVEKIRRKRVSLRTEEMINRIGLSLIIFLAIFVLYNDLIRYGVLEKIFEFFKK